MEKMGKYVHYKFNKNQLVGKSEIKGFGGSL